jgi:DNA-binding XRE family transcriptional regulator
MKSSAKPEPKARAAADTRDSLGSTDSSQDEAAAAPAELASDVDAVNEGAPMSGGEQGEADEADTPAAKPKRKPKASRPTASEPNNVRKLRQEAMMSKAELARRAGVSPLTIDRVEAGSPCRMDTKRKILEALGLSPSARAEVWPDIDDQG